MYPKDYLYTDCFTMYPKDYLYTDCFTKNFSEDDRSYEPINVHKVKEHVIDPEIAERIYAPSCKHVLRRSP